MAFRRQLANPIRTGDLQLALIRTRKIHPQNEGGQAIITKSDLWTLNTARPRSEERAISFDTFFSDTMDEQLILKGTLEGHVSLSTPSHAHVAQSRPSICRVDCRLDQHAERTNLVGAIC